jgi:hypothetical protein
VIARKLGLSKQNDFALRFHLLQERSIQPIVDIKNEQRTFSEPDYNYLMQRGLCRKPQLATSRRTTTMTIIHVNSCGRAQVDRNLYSLEMETVLENLDREFGHDYVPMDVFIDSRTMKEHFQDSSIQARLREYRSRSS